MYQLESQDGFTGFGNGSLAGELHHCLNMFLTPHGLAPFYKNTAATSGASIFGLATVQWFVEYGGTVWGVDEAGKVISKAANWQQERQLAVASSGNGMVVDQTGRLLIVNDRYLTKYTGAWTESWRDLGSSVAGPKGMDTYLDWVVIPHGPNVALLNVTDDSFSTVGLNFPSGCTCVVAKSSRTGVLLGVNMGARSFVALWDAQSDRSIADWIWFDHPLKSVCRGADGEWLVTTTRKLYRTNGYTKQELPDAPDPVLSEVLFNPLVGGTVSVGSLLYLCHTDVSVNLARRKSGLYIFDTDSQLWRFVPAADGATYDVSMGAVFEDSGSNVWLSHRNVKTGSYVVSRLTNDLPSTAYLITAPYGQGPNRKVAEGARVELLTNNLAQAASTLTFTVSVKVYDYGRPLWTYGNQSVTATLYDRLTVNGATGTTNNAAVGDEVTVLSGVNAGQVRHIAAVAAPGTTAEVWTLDSALPSLTEGGAFFGIQPFKLAKKFTVSNAAGLPTDGLYFDIQNRYRGKKFLLKVLFEGLSGAYLAVPSVSFIYDDQRMQ